MRYRDAPEYLEACEAGGLLKAMKESGQRHAGEGRQKEGSHDGSVKLSALGLTPNKSSRWQQLHSLDEGVVQGQSTLELDSGGKPAIIVNEAGMNQLSMRSKKPDAEKLQDWVYEEVLPSIRKTGAPRRGQVVCPFQPQVSRLAVASVGISPLRADYQNATSTSCGAAKRLA